MTGMIIFLLAVVVYAWLVYPLLVQAAARIAGRSATRAREHEIPRSKVVLLSAYNEERVIEGRVRNLLDCTDKDTRILVGADGCSDRTADIIGPLAEANERLRLRQFDERRGKMAVLKDLVKETMSGKGAEVLIFTDANVVFDQDAVRALCSTFSDEAVGGVCGRLVFFDRSVTGSGDIREGVYWRWETRLKQSESEVDSCLGANGAIYAIRASLFDFELPDNTIIDDFVIGMKVREAGYRMVYEPSAIAREELPDYASDEWERRVRIGAGDFQALALCRRCLLPRFGAFAWMLFSHKVLRWFTPHLALLVLMLSAVSAIMNRAAGACSISIYVAIAPLVAGVVLTLCAIVGGLARRSELRAVRIFQQCHYFMLMQGALLKGSLRFCQGNLRGYWSRTPR